MIDAKKIDKILKALIQGEKSYNTVAHEFYKDSIEIAEKIEDCLKEDELPDFIKKTVEKEKKKHKEYREKSFENVMLSFFKRVSNSLRNIRNADDFTIVWADSDKAKEFKEITETKFGNYGSLQEFFWNIVVANYYIKDPNSVIGVIPVESLDESGNRELMPILVDSDEVIDYQKGVFACLIIDDEVEYTTTSGDKKEDGIKVLFVDKEGYIIATQISEKQFEFTSLGNGSYNTESDSQNNEIIPIPHYAGELPVFKIGKSLEEVENDGLYELFCSEIQESLPHVRTALRRKSDLDIVNNKLANPKEWQYQTVGCETCGGTGKVDDFGEGGLKQKKNCHSCGGTGKAIWDSSQDVLLLTPITQKGFDDNQPSLNIPTPPAGYVILDPKAIESMRKEFSEEHDATYRSCGMEYLNYQPLSQSGKAKEQDAEEFKKILLDNEKHFVWMLNKLYSFSQGIYYMGKETELCPSIPLAMRFDVSNSEKTKEELKTAIQSNFSQSLIDVFTTQLLDSRAGIDSEQYKQYQLQARYDNYRGHTLQEKLLMKSSYYQLGNRNTEQQRNVINSIDKSINFVSILNDCKNNDENFLNLDITDQIKKMDEVFKAKYENILDASQPISDVKQVTVQPPVVMSDNNQNLK